ncbi:MAG: hypothetical protein AAB897_01775 [Patescibacteria group bacterium]
MKKSDYFLKSLINAAGVFVYVFGVVWLISNAKIIFGEQEPEGPIIPLFMLLLFIVSATITVLLVFGKPVYMYLDGLKREAIILLLSTLAWLILLLAVVAGVIIAQ